MTGTLSRTRRINIGWAVGIAFVFFCAYRVLNQSIPTYDGLLYIDFALENPPRAFELHPLYIYVLAAVIRVAAGLGIGLMTSGTGLAALCAGAALGGYFLLLRRIGISIGLAALFTFLIAWNHPLLENATSVEVYTPMLLALVLTLHAAWSEMRRPSKRHATLLWLSCTLLVLMHAAASLWVLALYLGLCHLRRGEPRRVIRYLLQGAGVAYVLGMVVLYCKAQIRGGDLPPDEFFAWFSQSTEGKSALMRAISAPMTDLCVNVGLGAFPALAGWQMMRRKYPMFEMMLPVLAMLYLGIFSYWTVDVGNFYLPLLVTLSIAAAYAVQRLLRRGRAWQWGLLCALLVSNGLLYMFRLRELTWALMNPPDRAMFLISFYGLLLLTWLLARAEARPRRRTAVPLGTYACLCMAAHLIYFTPRAMEHSRHGALGRQLHDFAELVPVWRMWHARLISAHFERDSPMTGLALLPTRVIGVGVYQNLKYDQHPLANWLRDEGKAGQDNEVWFDETSMAYARAHWNDAVLADLPMELFEFEAHRTTGETFYRARYKDQAEARRHAKRLDPYPAEDWGGGTMVQWLRPCAELPIEPQRGRLRLKFYVAHPDVHAGAPVRIETTLNGQPLGAITCTTQGMQMLEARAELGSTTRALLRVETTPGWTSPEGRALGVALYPVEWVKEP